MKKLFNQMLSYMIVAILLASIFPTIASAESSDLYAALNDMKPMKLNWAISMGSSHRVNEVFTYFADQIKERSKGKIEIIMYPGETLVKNNDIFESVINGIVDMGEADPSYSLSYFPLGSAYFLPGNNFADSSEATYVANEWYKQDFKELSRAKFLWAYGMSPSGLMTNVKIENLDDFKGVQIRGTGFSIDAIKALGAAPVGITPAETYEALLKGTADAVLMPLEALINWNFAEVSKYVTPIPGVSTVNHYICISNNIWNKIPKPVQEMIEEVSLECVDMVAPMWDEMDQIGLDFAKEKGSEIYSLSDETQAEILRSFEPVRSNWLKERENQGLDGENALYVLSDLIETYRNK
ncbi:MAG: TRAP transporter substrate-binding protein DctP [Christensenellales bacterium]|jgi:TRAP-type C4-dicarboxylate transport system substrate-binding protein